jgi:hypothetical protein
MQEHRAKPKDMPNQRSSWTQKEEKENVFIRTVLNFELKGH